MDNVDDLVKNMIEDRRALLNRPVPLPTFQKLLDLVRDKTISIGVNVRVAGAAWRGETIAGKLSALLFVFLFIGVPIAFWRLGWLAGFTWLFGFYSCHRIQVAVSCRWFREYLLERPDLFNAFYCQGNLGLNVRTTGQSVMVPTDWVVVVNELANQSQTAKISG